LGITNPLASIYAGINYALHTYGSLAALNRPGGYAFGTNSASPGWHLVGEHGAEWAKFRGGEQVLRHGRTPGIGGNHYHVTVNVRGALSTDREIQRAVSDGMADFERHGGNVPWVSK
jgi:SLT domain-containing protein